MSRPYLLLFCCIFQLHAFTSSAAKKNILFIGNSYIYVNDLPNTLKSLALSMGDSIEFDQSVPGGMTLLAHSTNAVTLAKIQTGNWDYVIIQAQSQEPAFDPTQVATDTYPYAKKLDSLVHVSNPCAETMFYMTWGRKNGDASNCPFYPPICTYEGMQLRLRESYLEMCLNNNASCVPAGMAWRALRLANPSIELYQADESHPSLHGTYLVACSFYASIFQKSCAAATYIPIGIGTADALQIQTIASNTVLDSIEIWQQYGSLPRALFTTTNSANNFSFNNNSLRSNSYLWDFGDGSPNSNLLSPTHTYASNGTFEVTLSSFNACGKVNTLKKNITVNGAPNNIGSINQTTCEIIYSQGLLHIQHPMEVNKISIYSLDGKKIVDYSLNHSFDSVNVHHLPKGIYQCVLFSGKKVYSRNKIMVN